MQSTCSEGRHTRACIRRTYTVRIYDHMGIKNEGKWEKMGSWDASNKFFSKGVVVKRVGVVTVLSSWAACAWSARKHKAQRAYVIGESGPYTNHTQKLQYMRVNKISEDLNCAVVVQKHATNNTFSIPQMLFKSYSWELCKSLRSRSRAPKVLVITTSIGLESRAI